MATSQYDVTWLCRRPFVVVSRYCLFVTLVSALLGMTAAGQPGVKSELQPLPTIQTTRELKRRELPHSYAVRLQPHEFLQVRVEQYSVDVVLRLRDASGRELVKIDSPNGTDGTETLSYIAETAGVYRFEVGALHLEETGYYAIQGDLPRPALAQDFRRIENERDFAEVSDELANGDPNEQLVAKLEAVYSRWQELNDEYLAQLTGPILRRLKQRVTELRAIEQLPPKQQAAIHRADQMRTEIAELEVKMPKQPAARSDSIKQIEEKLEQAFHLYQSINYKPGQVWCLFERGDLHQDDDNPSQALDNYRQALTVFSNVTTLTDDLRDYKARILIRTGKLERSGNQQDKAFEAFSDGVKLYEKDELEELRASLLLNLAETQEDFDNFEGAEQSFLAAKNIYHKMRMRGDEGVVLNKLGHLYSTQHSSKAFETFQDADQLLKYSNIRDRYIWNLVALSNEYSTLDDSENAKRYSALASAALANWDDEIDPHVKVVTYLEVGDLFEHLGKYAEAQESYKSGLTLADTHKVWVKDTVRYTFLKRLGDVAWELHNADEGNKYLLDALKLALGSQDKGLKAIGQITLGQIYLRGGKVEEAIGEFAAAQKTYADHGDADGIARAAAELGKAYSIAGNRELAWRNFKTALLHASIFGDDRQIAELSYDLMKSSAKLGDRRLAVFFGKQLVNLIQKYRVTLRILDSVTQRAFLKANSDIYRELAILLIQERRFSEARQVVQLYQDEGFYDVPRIQKEKPASLFLTKTEEMDLTAYDDIRTRINSFRQQLRHSLLTRGFAQRKPTQDEGNAQAVRDPNPFDKATDDFVKVIDRTLADFAGTSDSDGAGDIREKAKTNPAPADMRNAGAAIIQTIASESSFYVLLTTRNGIEAFSTKIQADDLSDKARIFVNLLALSPNPHRALLARRVQSASTELYKIIFKSISTTDPSRTIESALTQEGVRVLFWALDGNLRSVPVAALYDDERRQYVVEQYNNVAFTRALPEHLVMEAMPWKSRLCMATLDEHAGGLVALPEVRTALTTFCGRNLVLNQAFTSPKMIESLAAQQPGSLVLIVSHFLFEPGDAKHSVLVMGRGSDYSLKQMSETPKLFAGVDLLILAACQTAAQRQSENGAETEGFAELAQRLGAYSVIGTLWDIEPEGTARLLVEFHHLHEQHPGWSNAEALHQAQLSMLKQRVTGKGVDLTHPHYWAPFVLYGDFRVGSAQNKP